MSLLQILRDITAGFWRVDFRRLVALIGKFDRREAVESRLVKVRVLVLVLDNDGRIILGVVLFLGGVLVAQHDVQIGVARPF